MIRNLNAKNVVDNLVEKHQFDLILTSLFDPRNSQAPDNRAYYVGKAIENLSEKDRELLKQLKSSDLQNLRSDAPVISALDYIRTRK